MNYLNPISRPGGPGPWPVVALLAAVAALYLPWTWGDQLADLGGDSAVYVLSARHYAPFMARDPIAAALEADSQFPPLYPLLLALGGGAMDLRIAHALTSLCLIAAFAACYAALRAMGLGRWLALCAVTLFALMPGTLAQALQLKSEPLYLALSLGGLALLAAPAPGAGPRGYWIATALLTLALLTRSAGIALLPALLFALWRRRPAGWLWMAAAVPAPAIAWALLRQSQASYGGTLLDVLDVPLPALVGQFAAHAQATVTGLAQNVSQAPALWWALAPLGVLAAGVLALRLRRAEPDAWYVATYLAMIVAWPYPSEAQRFGWVLVPLLLGYSLWAGQALAARLPVAMDKARLALHWATPAGLALIVAPGFLFAILRWTDPAAGPDRALAHLPEWYDVDPARGHAQARRHVDLTRAVSALGEQVPHGECVYAVKAATVTYYARRHTFAPPPEAMADAEAEAWLQGGGCRYFLLLAATDGQYFATPYYPRDRLGDRLEILEARTGSESNVVVAALARLKR